MGRPAKWMQKLTGRESMCSPGAPSHRREIERLFWEYVATEAINDIADYIVGFYNSVRLHSKLGNMSPNAFERESTLKKSIELSEIT